nr:uncharacterized protein LOC109192368 [Ipomoea trifida]
MVTSKPSAFPKHETRRPFFFTPGCFVIPFAAASSAVSSSSIKLSPHAPPLGAGSAVFAAAAAGGGGGFDFINSAATTDADGPISEQTSDPPLAFPFDNRFLDSDKSAVNFEIYNVAWLRDLPIGTATLTLNSFFPPLTARKPAVRHAAIPIRSPSTGQIQGTINVTVKLIHDSPPETESGSQLSVSTVNKRDDGETSGEDEDKIDGDQNPELEIKSAKSVKIVSEKDDGSPGDMKLRNCPSFSASYVSGMRPLPSEVAAGLKKGLYYFPGEEDEYGSSIFENWSVPDETKSKSSKAVSWQVDHKVML